MSTALPYPQKTSLCPVLLVVVGLGGSPRAYWAWPGLWPGPRRQARWVGRGLRRSRVGPGDRFCEAVRNDLRVPLTLEGPTRTMRGVPARRCDISGDRCTRRDVDGLAVVLAGAAGDTAGTAGGRSPGVPCAAAAAP